MSPDPRPVLAPNSPVDRRLTPSPAGNRLELFGGGALKRDAGPVAGRAAQRHRIALLALLATTRRIQRSRDQLIAYLWPDADAERGRKLLSDSIYRINQALGGDVVCGSGDDLRINRLRLASDVADFEAAADAGDWRGVVGLYGGPFLDGFFLPDALEFDQWLEGERAQYARTFARALEALAAEAGEQGRAAEAAEWWQRLAAFAPDDSRVAMEVMRALAAAGNRAGAIRHANAHAAFLRSELGIEPDRAVHELADRIAARTEPARTVVTPIVHPGPTIAVLPFDGVGEGETTSYFADGVTEELIYLLTRTPGLRVASRTSSFNCRDLRLDVREVAGRLGVDWVLEGSARRGGDRVRVSAQLTDARTGYQVWSEAFDRHATDLLAIQTEIARAIAARVEPSVNGAAAPAPLAAAPFIRDPEVCDLYFQARFQLNRRTAESLTRSAELFEQVVAREPANARAWAGLADANAISGFYDYVAPRTAFLSAEAAARHARRLDPTLTGPHATLAYIDTYFHWNWESAEEGFRRAIALEPTSSAAHHWYGTFLASRGRFDEAERELRSAAELDPLSMIMHAAIGWALVLAGESERAVRQLESALRLDPTYCLLYYFMGMAHEQAGNLPRAMELVQHSTELSPQASICAAGLARLCARAGDLTAAHRLFGTLLEREARGVYVASYLIASIHHALGDVPATLTRLERAYAEREHAIAYLHLDPQFRSIANQPRFRRLVEQVEQRIGSAA